jgi:hypothetical protein
MAQQSFKQFTKSVVSRPGNYAVVQRIKDAVTGIADDLGVSLDLFGARPGELDDSTGVLRYQYSTTFEYYTGRKSDDTEIGQVQFRTTLYTLTPPSDRLKQYIKQTNHLRLHTLFETQEYDGYMSGFGFISSSENEEDVQAAAQDEIPASGLGVPNFSCEVYDEDGQIAGYSKGYSMDFGVHEDQVVTGGDAPEGEVWKVRSFNDNEGAYEIGPDAYTNARERAKNASGKTVYINGIPTGSVTSRGTTWLKKQHKSPSRATWRSRRYLTENTGTPYQALSQGSKLYKVNETAEGLYFSTVEPSNFSQIAPDEVDPDATQTVDTEKVMDLNDDEPTVFVVVKDEADPWALGKRKNGQTVEISRTTRFSTTTTAQGARRP